MKKEKNIAFNPIGLFFSSILNFTLYFLSLLLPVYLIFISSKNFLFFALTLVSSLYIFNFALLFFSLIVIKLLPNLKEGVYSASSIKTSLYEFKIILYSKIINNPFSSIIKDDIFLSNIFYKLLGLKSSGFFVINFNSIIADPWHTEIGNNVIISSNCIISAHIMENGKLIIKKVKLKDNSILGFNSAMGPGTELGENSLLGAFSALKKFTKIPNNEVWVGIPAKKLKRYNKK